MYVGGQQYRISRGSLQHPVPACQLLNKDPWPYFHSTAKLYGVNKGKKLKMFSYLMKQLAFFKMFKTFPCFLFPVPLHLCTNCGVRQLQIFVIAEDR